MRKTPDRHKIITLLVVSLMSFAVSSSVWAQSEQAANTSTTAPTDSSSRGKLHHWHAGWENLSKSERKQIKSALKLVKKDPKVVAVKQAVTDAQTKDEKRASKKTLKQLKHDLLLKEDPSLEPILEKIHCVKKE